MLALAAFLTAFYTMRQISLTFLGEPRSPLAEHAHESNNFMTIPLLILAVFAVIAGWFGIPENFLGTEGIFVNYFHEYAGATIHTLFHDLYEMDLVAHEIITLPWSWVPLIISLVVALGGLALGWLMYARRPLARDEVDPLVAVSAQPIVFSIASGNGMNCTRPPSFGRTTSWPTPPTRSWIGVLLMPSYTSSPVPLMRLVRLHAASRKW